MKGLRVAIVITAAVALLVILLGPAVVALLELLLGPQYGGDIGQGLILLLGGFIALLGTLVAIAAVVLGAIDAGRRSDWWSFALLILQPALSIGAVVYLVVAENATNGPGGSTTATPSTVLVTALEVACVVAVPVAALLYGLLQAQITIHRITLAALVALIALASLVTAPPWVVFAPANGAPLLTTSAPPVSVNCQTGPYPPITVLNTGSGTLHWTAAVLPKPIIAPVSISPASGTLGPGMKETVTLSPPSSSTGGPYQSVNVEFTSNGGETDVVFKCQ